jgi:hypothetical protein
MARARCENLSPQVSYDRHRSISSGRRGGHRLLAQALVADERPRTTKLHDRTGDEITLDEVERIAI